MLITAGQLAMALESTAALRSVVASVGNKFEVGTGCLPRPAALYLSQSSYSA